MLAPLLAAALLATAHVSAPAPARPVPRLDHVVLILLENEERPDVLGSGEARGLDGLAKRYVNLAQYFAVTHPSLPNYLALVSGSTQGITDDCTDCVANGTTIGDQLTRAGRAWGGYAEGYPGSSRFAKKHMPLLYFPRDRTHVFPLSALNRSKPPAFAFVAPDLCHDMHDCSISVGDRWVSSFVKPLLAVPRTVVFVVFDEGTSNVHGGGHIAAIAAGTAVKRGVTSTQLATHYSLLRTIEDALGLPHLGAAAHAKPLQGIWR